MDFEFLVHIDFDIVVRIVAVKFRNQIVQEIWQWKKPFQNYQSTATIATKFFYVLKFEFINHNTVSNGLSE